MTDWIGDTFTSDAGWDHLESLVDIDHRMAGSDGERAGLELTRDALSHAGARDARIEEFEIQGWERGDSEIRRDEEVVASGQNACIALPRSPSGEATGEFVDLGYGVPEDFDDDLTGKVVMVSSDTPDSVDRFIHRREKYYHAVEAGAAAFVFANHVEGTLPPTGSVGTADAPIGDIPAVGVSKETGASLAPTRRARTSPSQSTARRPTRRGGTRSPTSVPTPTSTLVVSPRRRRPRPRGGAMDNGAGTATIVEVANALAAREEELDTRVRFVGFGAEEVGLVGSSQFAAGVDPDHVKAVVNVDSNVFGRTPEARSPRLRPAGGGRRARERPVRSPDRARRGAGPHSDHWPFVERGIPGYMVSGETEGRGRGWGTHGCGHARQAGVSEPPRAGDPPDGARRRPRRRRRVDRAEANRRDRERARTRGGGDGDEDNRRLAVLAPLARREPGGFHTHRSHPRTWKRRNAALPSSATTDDRRSSETRSGTPGTPHRPRKHERREEDDR